MESRQPPSQQNDQTGSEKTSESSSSSSSSERDPLTKSFSRLVDRARQLARSSQTSASPRGGSVPRSSRQELDEILNKFEQWSSSSVQTKPHEDPDPFVPLDAGGSAESAGHTSAELPSKGFLERLVDAVDHVTGGAEETFPSESKVTSLFSRADKPRSDAPLTPEARQNTQRLQAKLRRVSSIRSGSEDIMKADSSVTRDPKIEIYKPASMESSGSETTGSFLARLLWGRKESHEEKIEAEVDKWIESRVEQTSPTSQLPTKVESVRRRPNAEGTKASATRASTILNVLDNTVAQLRLRDDAEKERVKRQRELLERETSSSPVRKTRSKLESSSSALAQKPKRIKRIVFSKCQLLKQLQAGDSLKGYEDDVHKITNRLDQQFLANLDAVRKAQPHPHYL